MSRHAFFLVSSCALLLIASSGFAADYYVNGTTGDDSYDGLAPAWDGLHGPKATIQAGIDAASDTDTVTVADGTYTGDGNRDLDFGGKAITLISENGPDTCIIDCKGSLCGFHFGSGEDADSVVDGFTISNATHSGIFCSCSSPTISNCVIRNNTALGSGGGMVLSGGSPAILDCTIKANAANSGPGIICSLSSPTITRCTILGNRGDSGGGVLSFQSEPVLTSCRIAGNSAEAGGGICSYSSTPRIADCTITGNAADDEGGGIYCWGSTSTITNCTITGNSSDVGGGICCYESSLAITNCTISDNVAEYGAGGVCIVYGCDATISNCILWANTAPNGHEIAMSYATLTVRYCDVQGGAAEIPLWAVSTLDYDASNIDADPLFRDAANGDYRLQRRSPCIDAGTSDGAPERDIVGARRWDVPWIPNTGGGEMPWYDIGAYEYLPGRRWGHRWPHPPKGPKHHWPFWRWPWRGRDIGCEHDEKPAHGKSRK